MRARLAEGAEDMARVLALRRSGFADDAADAFDARADHLMIEGEGGLLATARALRLAPGALADSYSAQFYDLRALAARGGAAVEIGRLCLAPALRGGPAAWEALRLAFATLTRIADQDDAAMLIGCASFPGGDWQRHRGPLAWLAAHHLGPVELRPGPGVADPVDYPALAGECPDPRAGEAGLPPLLRFYLGLGGWVSDHAVRDRQFDTLHVFTCVETAKIPKARKKALRALAGQ
ncbi:GNAT family N-acyltransferase [Pseudogemmobacter humi]|uniref:Hemolysin n=1 Tax=Pseudogemmobacter humi TaxID=2483812 RepID=A0A3P5XRJ6_9RHOB|nr:GNAT family N-acyltransferase [Pseudogemmobacter humi]VDC31568.1 hypothetical protein XINFAN_02956 [Pseudogemmobacter humi]